MYNKTKYKEKKGNLVNGKRKRERGRGKRETKKLDKKIEKTEHQSTPVEKNKVFNVSVPA